MSNPNLNSMGGSVNIHPTFKSKKSRNVEDWELLDTVMSLTGSARAPTAAEISTEIALTESATKDRLRKCRNKRLVDKGDLPDRIEWYITNKGYHKFKEFVINDLGLIISANELSFGIGTTIYADISSEDGIRCYKMAGVGDSVNPTPSNPTVSISRPTYKMEPKSVPNCDEYILLTYYEWENGHYPGHTFRKLLKKRKIPKNQWRELLFNADLKPTILDMTCREIPSSDFKITHYWESKPQIPK